jgi:hypothetical protein
MTAIFPEGLVGYSVEDGKVYTAFSSLGWSELGRTTHWLVKRDYDVLHSDIEDGAGELQPCPGKKPGEDGFFLVCKTHNGAGVGGHCGGRRKDGIDHDPSLWRSAPPNRVGCTQDRGAACSDIDESRHWQTAEMVAVRVGGRGRVRFVTVRHGINHVRLLILPQRLLSVFASIGTTVHCHKSFRKRVALTLIFTALETL